MKTRLGPLADLVRGKRIAVLTGAGCSTESGIPDYRGPEGTLRHREPMRFQEFMGSPEGRRRYWARSMVGWPRFRQARPNDAHRALVRLEAMGLATGVITQNVDRLHQVAGSRNVVDLHGALHRVRCMGCGTRTPRDVVQDWLLEANPGWAGSATEIKADGDAETTVDSLDGFRVPDCPRCRAILKPDVVFFGENVPRPWVDEAWAILNAAEVLLVVGSSLTVFSGRRFVVRARKEDKPVGIVNQGVTRSDADAAVKMNGRVGEVLPRLVRMLEEAA